MGTQSQGEASLVSEIPNLKYDWIPIVLSMVEILIQWTLMMKISMSSGRVPQGNKLTPNEKTKILELRIPCIK